MAPFSGVPRRRGVGIVGITDCYTEPILECRNIPLIRNLAMSMVRKPQSCCGPWEGPANTQRV